MSDIPVHADDLFGAMGMTGDNVNEFVDAFADQFNVDMQTFLWYFHYNGDEPGLYRRVLPYLPNGKVAPYQPITFTNLVDAARSGHWDGSYPKHTLKTVGWKDILQYILIALVALWIVASLLL